MHAIQLLTEERDPADDRGSQWFGRWRFLLFACFEESLVEFINLLILWDGVEGEKFPIGAYFFGFYLFC